MKTHILIKDRDGDKIVPINLLMIYQQGKNYYYRLLIDGYYSHLINQMEYERLSLELGIK